jgi:hypothetical protein
MKRNHATLSTLTILMLFLASAVLSQDADELKIDPLLLVSLKECRNITKTLGDEFYPGWDFQKTPVLFYRPNVQELLINYPHKPEGFSEYTGLTPLKNEPIYVRNDTTIFSIDDQNTSTEIEGIAVLVVADPFSRMRNQIRGAVLNRTKDFVVDWLEEWNFLQSPYDEIRMILHEAFHIFQEKMAPEKFANEMTVAIYPLLDPVNNSLYALEGHILRNALLSKDPKERMEKIKEFVAVRMFRQSRLEEDVVEYENTNEYVEGTAKYVEYKFLEIGEIVEPIEEMYYHNGFNGYSGILSKQFEDEINDMVKIVSVSDNRFGNKYGTGPMRFRLYELGACQALLLDEVMPEWKNKIFDEDVYLCNLLRNAVKLSKRDSQKYLKQAKIEHNYDQVYQEKLVFEQEGKKRIQEKMDSILKTDNTLVTIPYQGYTDEIGIGFTPFGVTQISENSAIYDMVPIAVGFKKGVVLQFKKVIPVIIDKEKKEIIFAIDSPVSQFGSGPASQLDTDEFTLSDVKMEIEKKGNHITIQLK